MNIIHISQSCIINSRASLQQFKSDQCIARFSTPRRQQRSSTVRKSVLNDQIAASEASSASDYETRLAKAAADVTAKLKAAVEAEVEDSRRAFESQTLSKPISSLSKHGNLLLDLVSVPSGRLYADLLYTFNLPTDQRLPFHKFSAGQSILIYPQPPSRGTETPASRKLSALVNTGLDPIEATVAETASFYLQVAVKADDAPNLRPGNSYCILANGLNDITAKRQFAALDAFKLPPKTQGEATLRAILLQLPQADKLASKPPPHVANPDFRLAAKTALERLNSQLNESQQVAIASALVRTLSLWQGPPGTGKTKTLTQYIRVVVAICVQLQQFASLLPILAVAETNTAADNLLETLLEYGIRAVRSGMAAKVRPTLQHVTVDALAENSRQGRKAKLLRDNAVNQLSNASKAFAKSWISEQQWRQAQREVKMQLKEADNVLDEAVLVVMRTAHVIVTTCSSAGDARFNDINFPIVCIDEASQATEPSTLIPILNGCETLIMAGDQNQLAPTILSQKPAARALELTLFNRLVNNNIPTFLLDQQYRMHPDIAYFPSQQFYNGRVSSAVLAEQRPLVAASPWNVTNKNVAFVPCNCQDARSKLGGYAVEGASYENIGQAELALKCLKSVLTDTSVESIAILTPYNGQLRALTSMLPQQMPEVLTNASLTFSLSTVDGFQGQEADVVIFSTVRCNAEGKVGFLSDKRRLNVAITRARRGLCVIGCPRTLSNDENWNAWLQWYKLYGTDGGGDR